MKKLVLAVLVYGLLSMVYGLSFAETADQAYNSAHECYVSLRGDAGAQKLREPWKRCIKLFETVRKKYARSLEGAEAQYSLGRLYEELAFNSKNLADWKRSVKEYESFARAYSTNKMADDAYFRAACIEWEKLNDEGAARKDLIKVIKHYKNGDKAGEARKYLEAVDAGTPMNETVLKVSVVKVPPRKIESKVKPVIVVLDPGHGGNDTGAIGPDGVKEKDLTLPISKKIAAELKKQIEGVQVYLTRNEDKTLDLGERVKFANKKKADYFISVHANASKSRKDRGIQTYYLNNASDEASERLASQENKYAGRKTSNLEKIIATMLQNEATDGSRALAGSVHKKIVSNLSKKYSGIEDDKVRSALFYVLVGVKCPSILVETSYMSNPKEEKRLKTDAYQRIIAASVAAGLNDNIKNYRPKAL